jgi:hypothetical protein
VAFDIKRHGRGEGARFAQQQELRAPAAPRRSAAGFVQRVQEFVAQEGLLAGERIPLLRRDRIERGDDVEGRAGFPRAAAAFFSAGYVERSRCEARRRAAKRRGVEIGIEAGSCHELRNRY